MDTLRIGYEVKDPGTVKGTFKLREKASSGRQHKIHADGHPGNVEEVYVATLK